MDKKETIQFIYPAVFAQAEGEIAVNFPDLNIATEGETYESAYLYAQDYLRQFLIYCLNEDYEIPFPTLFQNIKNRNDMAMLIDALIFPKDLK